MKVPLWLWGIWIGVFVILEGVALYDGTPNDTLTQTILHNVPGIAVVLFCVWLGVHFIRRVLKGRRDGL